MMALKRRDSKMTRMGVNSISLEGSRGSISTSEGHRSTIPGANWQATGGILYLCEIKQNDG
jgi:hypothetical protein